ncbi:eukaryotic translation initiation factor 3 subunit, putative [Trypanosoma cruzi marinkellei]|uniref:Eukaryotic translation initiation factor 3 subunit, putative n=1 Tax=Trypanosoma cruzi marinkellei TaxID=85056 RepID=K2MNZ7_TRYCR|nr:eukaryotic translation initiation factor 3 subunit, putative [Trypanosoma cruzi marinkellei]
MPTEITVLSFNLWGIFNSKHRAARMARFAAKVANYDIILLQEQFSKEDFEIIISNLPSEVREKRYFKRFPSAFYGSGIAVISRFPIKSALFFTFPLQGYPERVFHGDYYANKGASLLCIHVPCTKRAGVSSDPHYEEVLLYNTHLVAAYQKTARLLNWRDELYLSVRLSQAISLAEFISSTSHPTDRVIIGGDFNATQRSLELQAMLILLRKRGYKLVSVLPPSIVYRPEMSEHEKKINTATLTYSDANIFNTPKDGWFVEGGDVPCQIDHIFFTSNTLRLSAFNDCPDAAADYPFKMPINGKEGPAGVVVFTGNNEVQLPPEEGLGVKVLKCFSRLSGLFWFGQLFTLSDRRTNENSANTLEPGFCAISDHYGVTARFQLGEEEEEVDGSTAVEKKLAPKKRDVEVALTKAEVETLTEAAVFLDDSVNKLYRESRICMWLAAAMTAVVLGNLIYMEYQAQQREEHTGRVLKELFKFARLRGSAMGQEEFSLGFDSTSWKQWLQRVFSIHSDNSHTATGTKSQTVASADKALDYAGIASKLHSRGLWGLVSPVITICGSILSVASVAVALLQRVANAKVMTEQVNMLKQACQG